MIIVYSSTPTGTHSEIPSMTRLRTVRLSKEMESVDRPNSCATASSRWRLTDSSSSCVGSTSSIPSFIVVRWTPTATEK